MHKKMLAVVITDAGREGEFRFERRKFGALPGDLRLLRETLRMPSGWCGGTSPEN